MYLFHVQYLNVLCLWLQVLDRWNNQQTSIVTTRQYASCATVENLTGTATTFIAVFLINILFFLSLMQISRCCCVSAVRSPSTACQSNTVASAVVIIIVWKRANLAVTPLHWLPEV